MSITVAAAAPSAALEFSAQTRTGERTLLYTFFNCIRHIPGGGAGAFAEHGKVTIEDTYLSQCGNAREPARRAWYTSNPGFKGLDKVTFPFGPLTTLVFDVTVR